jgi:metal-responsive CopG/Arc/MetJ family transcriptional regulator
MKNRIINTSIRLNKDEQQTLDAFMIRHELNNKSNVIRQILINEISKKFEAKPSN